MRIACVPTVGTYTAFMLARKKTGDLLWSVEHHRHYRGSPESWCPPACSENSDELMSPNKVRSVLLHLPLIEQTINVLD